MSPELTSITEKAKNFWVKTNVSQRILIGGLTTTVIVTFFLLIFWLNQPDYQVLYSRLYPEDASTVVNLLQAEKIPYKLEDNGSVIMVPADKVYDLRLKIAGEGNLHGQGLGFEIFDDVQVGQTDFVQRINYQRALQGELARTISEFPQVDRARVHLVLPHKTLFVEEQSKPSASVVLKLKSGEKMEPKEVDGIVNLIALAVEGMDPNMITVADTTGVMLFTPRGLESSQGMSSTQLGQKVSIENNLEQRIEQMLMPLYGPGRVIAKVNAELDFSRKTSRYEEYDPESAVVRSEQRSEETQQGDANIQSGSPEPNFRGEGGGPATSNQQGSRESRTTNYEINKVEREVISPMGELKRLTVAVIVDGIYTEQPIGDAAEGEATQTEFAFTPRSAEELNRVKQLVANAVGVDDMRGDTIQVSSISFGGPEMEIRPDVLELVLEYVQRLGKPFLNGLLIFLFLVMVVRPVVMALIRPKTEVEGVEGIAGLPEGEGRIALIEGDDEEDALDALRKIDDIRAHALQLSEQNMDGTMAIIKNWLKQEAPA
ncbi:flagellar basal-body MS-ring/collar protein FliF [Desulfovibrio ferrophilus]|uniref:Flagellar M-ring protein n=1 Tax=Desulfovibrio ferrophilus TaxID=241368 RepID=A0A2Z6B1S3_9BACT|nr:flagellar basal-body MS-ring/collar protein FliF [Desulfovibrio ferrophilus]BBD09346.1 flagellar M-ring protein FliF [Desulfovibrio ferrophilus]